MAECADASNNKSMYVESIIFMFALDYLGKSPNQPTKGRKGLMILRGKIVVS